MGSSIADRPVDSSPSSKTDLRARLSRVEIVPGEETPGSGVMFSPDPAPPFLGDQHETVISKQPASGSSNRSFEPPRLIAASTPGEMGALLEGTALGHFRLEKFVGGGGMGAVFRAIDTRLGRTVAVKVLSRDRTDEDTLRRFQNEAQSAARLDHENIARVYYVGEDRGLHFIVFEFIEGINIRDLVEQKGPLPLEEAISYLLQVAEALEHASLRNVIHRDIKPSNVLVTPERRAKLVDMGLARLHQLEAGAGDLTASGVTLGTFDYISPEQARDPRTADVRSDLYSLGCTFYYMLTGRPPFPEGTVLQKLLSHSSDEPADPRSLRPGLDDGLVLVLERLLAKQPARRFQRPNELIGQLLLVAERLNMKTITQNGTVWVAPPRTGFSLLERSLPWIVPAALFLGLMGMIHIFWSPGEPFEFGQAPIHLQPLDPPASSAEQLPTPEAMDESAVAPGAVASGLPPGDLPPGDAPAEVLPPELSTAIASPLAAPKGSDAEARLAEQESIDSTTPAASPVPVVPLGEPLAPLAPPVPYSTDDQTPASTRPSANGDVAPVDAPPGEPSAQPIPVAPLTPIPPTSQESATGSNSSSTQPPMPSPAAAPHPAPEAATTSSPWADSAATPLASPSSAPAREATSPPTVAKFSRIVVADSSTPWPQDTLAVSSLAAACRDARQWGVRQIELHYNGPRLESNVEIADIELTISAAAGFQPLVVFRPTGNDPNSGPAMIRCSGTRLSWQGVHLLLDLTEAPSQSWSLFRLRPFASVDVRDSIFTIRNVDVSQRKRLEQVDFFVLEHRNAGGRSADAAPAPIPHHANLTNTILRGQATVVRAEQATAFRLFLQNSLVVARGWLVDVEGSGAKPSLKEGRVDVVLKDTTASLRDGLCRMASDQQTPHQLDLHTEFSDSILYLTASDAPLFERIGVSRLADVEKRFDLRGRDNFYPGSTTVLRLRPNAPFGEVLDFDFDSRDRMPFLEEKSPGFMLMWESLPAAELTEDQHTAEDYQLDESKFNPGILIGDTETAGVDISRLPPARPLSAAAGTSTAPNS